MFGERVWCLRQLAATLRDRHGIEAHVADGSITRREFETLKRRFTAGEFPVLCLSRIGHEGHNLQNASVLCHLDLPWLPTGLEQRVGRAARPGAARAHVQTYIPYIRGGGDRARRLRARRARRRAPPDPRQLRRRPSRREHRRHAARPDHRPGRRQQGRRRLRRHRRTAAGRRQRVRQLTAHNKTHEARAPAARPAPARSLSKTQARRRRA